MRCISDVRLLVPRGVEVGYGVLGTLAREDSRRCSPKPARTSGLWVRRISSHLSRFI